MQIEYVLFFVGVSILVVTLFLSYRLEKNKKQDNSNTRVLKEIKQLKALYKKNKGSEDLKKEIDDLYKLIDYKLNTTNNELKTTQSKIKNIAAIKDDFENIRNEISVALDDLDSKINDLGEKNEKISSEVKHNLEGINYRDNLNSIEEDINSLFTGFNEMNQDISMFKEILTQKIKQDEENKKESKNTDKNGTIMQNKTDGRNDKIITTSFDNNREQETEIKKESSSDSQITNNNIETEINTAQVPDEKQKKKYNLYQKIKEMKEEGRDITEIADRVNMGIREVELFWKVNSRG